VCLGTFGVINPEDQNNNTELFLYTSVFFIVPVVTLVSVDSVYVM
jgi:hypothetical protein